MANETKQPKKLEYNMAEETRYQNILLEELRGQFQLFSEGLCALTEKVDGLDQKVNGLDQKVDRLDQKVDGLGRKVGGLELRMDQFEIAMLQYNLEMKRHNQVMESLRKDVNRHDDDIVTLKTAVGIKI